MPRDANGNYTLPAGNPVVTGTPISSATQNLTMDDVAAELEDSLSRSGKGGMLVPFQFNDGTMAEPGIAFTNDLDTGIFRDTANELAISAGGAESARFTATGVEVPGDLAVAGSINLDSLDVTGNATIGGTLAVTGTSTFTGRITASAGVAGLLPGDIPSPGEIDVSAAAPAAVTGDTNWHDLTAESAAVTLTATSRVVLNVGPMAAQAGPTYATGDIDGGGSPSQALIRLVRAIGPGFSSWIDVAAIETWETSGGSEGIPNVSFSTIDKPGTGGDYKYKIQGAVGNAGATMTIKCIRLTGIIF